MYIYFWKKDESDGGGLTKRGKRGYNMGGNKIAVYRSETDKLLMNNEVAASG
jgi:hypothetical protein